MSHPYVSFKFMNYTHDEFIKMVKNNDWVIGIVNFRPALQVCSSWYLSFKFYCGHTFIVFALIIYCVLVSQRFGYGCLIGIPIGAWITWVGRPNINMFDVIWLVFVGILVSIVASVLSWKYNLSLIGIGFVPFSLAGIIKYDVLEGIKKRCVNNVEVYQSLVKSKNLLLCRMT